MGKCSVFLIFSLEIAYYQHRMRRSISGTGAMTAPLHYGSPISMMWRMKNFGQRLEEKRLKAGISITFAAMHAGMERADWKRFERGTKPAGPMAFKRMALVPGLGLSITEMEAWKILDLYSVEALRKASRIAAAETRKR